MSAEQSPFSDHCPDEFEVVSSIHNIIARTDGLYVVKIRGKEEGPVEPKYRAIISQITEAVMPSLSSAPVLKE